MGAKWLGRDGSFVPGIPARDLTDEELEEFPTARVSPHYWVDGEPDPRVVAAEARAAAVAAALEAEAEGGEWDHAAEVVEPREADGDATVSVDGEALDDERTNEGDE